MKNGDLYSDRTVHKLADDFLATSVCNKYTRLSTVVAGVWATYKQVCTNRHKFCFITHTVDSLRSSYEIRWHKAGNILLFSVFVGNCESFDIP